jgi:hypothetical protein
VLWAVPGVLSLDDGPRPGDPWILTVAPGSEPTTVRSGILAAVAAEGLPLASIRAVVPSLEDVYRRAVARPAATGATPTSRHDAARVAAAGVASKSETDAAGRPTTTAPTPVEPVILPPDDRPVEGPR